MAEQKKQSISRAFGTAGIVLAVLFACLLALSFVLTPKDNSPESGMVDAEAYGVLGEPVGTVDLIVMGNSETFTSFTPLHMWHERGFTSYVCGTKGQMLPHADVVLHRVTETHRPRIVIIEADMVYEPAPASVVATRLGKWLLPVFEYHNRWKQLTLEDFTTLPKATWTDPFKGYQINRDVNPAQPRDYMAPTDAVQPIERMNELLLRDMVNHCRAIGATPILVSAPSMNNWSMAKHNGISAWAQSAGVVYKDFNLPESGAHIDWTRDTRDSGTHLNHCGAVKFSSAFGAWLSENYDMPDHRGDDAYSSWHAAYDHYARVVENAREGAGSVSEHS